MEKVRLFYSGVYRCWHREITPENIREKLKDDVRSRLVNSVDDILNYNPDGVATKNPVVQYMGGFYYEKQTEGKSVTECVVQSELDEIDQSDIVVVNLLGDNAIASVSELLYAVKQRKRVEVFVKDEADTFDVTGKYWFPIHAANRIAMADYCMNLVTVHRVNSDDDVVDYILNIQSVDQIQSLPVITVPIIIEGTDGVGKSTVIKSLRSFFDNMKIVETPFNGGSHELVLQFLDRETSVVSANMLFDIGMEDRATRIRDYLIHTESNLVFLVNYDGNELMRRIETRDKPISDFDRDAPKYNQLYADTYKYMHDHRMCRHCVRLVDVTNAPVDAEYSKTLTAIFDLLANRAKFFDCGITTKTIT